MRRLSFVMAYGLLVAGCTDLLLAQHAGGAGGGGHASFGGGHSGFSGHSTSGYSGTAHSSHFYGSSYSTSANPGQLRYPTNIGLQQTFSGYTGINRGAIPSGIRRARFGVGGRGYAGGYFAYPYIYSGFDDYNEPYTYSDYPAAPAPEADVNSNMLGEQVARLAAEVDALRAGREAGQEGQEVRPSYIAPPELPEQAQNTPPVVLVMKSGQQVKLNSYAVMGQDIWDFSVQPAKRISVASLNLDASRSATEAGGAEFPEIR